jgi:hypothetical protein
LLLIVLMSPTAASAYAFGDWARGEGYEPGDVMPIGVDAWYSSIDSLDGIGEFDWTTTPTWELRLEGSQTSNIEPGTFSGLTNLARSSTSSTLPTTCGRSAGWMT